MIRGISILGSTKRCAVFVFICIIQIAVNTQGLYAQHSFSHYTVEDGLASTVVHDMLIDHLGYLWVATEAGVNRFNGNEFTHFTTRDGLGGNEVLKMTLDSQNRIWFITFNGILSYYQDGTFFNPTNRPILDVFSKNASLTSVFEDDAGNIWVTTEFGHVMKMNQDSVTEYTFGLENNSNIRSIWQVDNQMYFSTFAGIYRWEEPNTHWEMVDSLPYWSLKSYFHSDGSVLIPGQRAIVHSKQNDAQYFLNANLDLKSPPHSVLVTPKTNTLLIGTLDDGVYFYPDFGSGLPKLASKWLENTTISSMIMDPEGSIWISTLNHGIYRIDMGFSQFKYIDDQNGLYDPVIRSSQITSDGTIWFGGKDGGVYRFSADGELLFRGRIIQGHALNSSIEVLLEPEYGTLLIGTIGGLYKLDYTNDKQLDRWMDTNFYDDIINYNLLYTPYSIKAIDGNLDTLFVGSNRHLFSITGENLNVNTKFLNIRITSMLSHQNRLWIGTLNGLKFLSENQIESIDVEILNRAQIHGIDKVYGPWIAISTYGNGLILFCTETGTIRIIDESTGLTSNLVKSTFFDNGELWIATHSGVNKVTLDTTRYLSDQINNLPIITYTTSDGLNVNQISMVKVLNDHVWISGNRGIARFRSDYIGYEDARIPLILEEILVNGVPHPIVDELQLRHNQNQLEVRFAGIFLRDGQKVRYKHRILELSDEWSMDHGTTLGFRYLNPGIYTLEIAAYSLDHRVTSTPVVLKIKVNNPFWLTSWFLITLLALIAVTVYALIRWRVQFALIDEQNKQAVSAKVVELEHQALMSMMRPHTIFNQLSVLKLYLFRGDTVKANEMIMNFTRLIRMQLDSSFKKITPLSDEFERIKLQIDLDKEKFEEGLKVEFNIDPAINPDVLHVPSLILQPFIENSINHGMMNFRDFGVIVIGANIGENGQLLLSVADNGAGFKDKDEILVNSMTPYEKIYELIPHGDKNKIDNGSPSIGLILFIERIRLIALERSLNWSVKFNNLKDEHDNIIGSSVEILLPVLADTNARL